MTRPWFWRTQEGAEIDVAVEQHGERLGIEIRRTDQPKVTPSMRDAIADLGLDRLVVVHAGEHEFDLAPKIRAVSLAGIVFLNP